MRSDDIISCACLLSVRMRSWHVTRNGKVITPGCCNVLNQLIFENKSLRRRMCHTLRGYLRCSRWIRWCFESRVLHRKFCGSETPPKSRGILKRWLMGCAPVLSRAALPAVLHLGNWGQFHDLAGNPWHLRHHPTMVVPLADSGCLKFNTLREIFVLPTSKTNHEHCHQFDLHNRAAHVSQC